MNPDVLKLFHYGRFDIAAMYNAFGALAAPPVYCTKIASRMVRTYTDRHGLKNLTQELIGVDISKQQQSSDWGAPPQADRSPPKSIMQRLMSCICISCARFEHAAGP